jgi:large-conductance mechanosensitive channel
MNDTPGAFLAEFRRSVLKRRIGWIAIAIILAQAILRLMSGVTYYFIVPVLGRMFGGNSDSVLFKGTSDPLPFPKLFGTLLEFGLTIVVVFYLNLWALGKPLPGPANSMEEEVESKLEPDPSLNVDLGSLANVNPKVAENHKTT